MNANVVWLVFFVLLGFLTTWGDFRQCFDTFTHENRDCPLDRPKCCGTRKHGGSTIQCAVSCTNHQCERNYDCDGEICCHGKCVDSSNCYPITTWGVVGTAVALMVVIVILLRICLWLRRRKARRRRTRERRRTTTSRHNPDTPAFFVPGVENDGFRTPLEPPPYDSIVQNDRLTGQDNDRQAYHLNLQTIVNNSSRDESSPYSLVHEINISITGPTIINGDLPPSYSEIDSNNSQPPLYSRNEDGIENFERGNAGFCDEPPPYSLDRETGSSDTETRISENAELNLDNLSSQNFQNARSSTSLEMRSEQSQDTSNTAGNISESTEERLGVEASSGGSNDEARTFSETLDSSTQSRNIAPNSNVPEGDSTHQRSS